jgi:molybdopterin synthase catalytic subunit
VLRGCPSTGSGSRLLSAVPGFAYCLSSDPIPQGATTFADGEGADVQFLGTVRGEEDGRAISGIEYSVYQPMADKELEKLCERGQREHGPHRVEIQHRLGFVAAREPSIVIRVKTRHSAEAFDLCRWYLKEVKTSVPIWKKPVFA